MKKLNILLMFLLLAACLCSCNGKSDVPSKKTFTAMDTAVTITAYGSNAEDIIEQSENEIHRLDNLMSRSSENGDILPLNNNGKGIVSNETAFIINMALDICKSTDGAFDITVAPIMDLWGFFGHDYRVPSDEQLTEQLKRVDYKNIEIENNDISLKNNSMLDLGGIAKGYASDRVTEIFNKNNIKSGLISFGSAIQAIGTKPDGKKWRIGIMNPQDKSSYIATLDLTDKCIVTSGSYEQVFEENGEQYHHIIDTSTGYPSKSGLASVSIITDNAARADALSTALFVMGMDKAVEYWRNNGGFDVIFITDDNKIFYTDGIKNDLSVSDDAQVIE